MKRRELLGTLGAGAVMLTAGRVEGTGAEPIGPDELVDLFRVNGAGSARPLAEVAPPLAQILKRSAILTPAKYGASEIKVETVMVAMRDGIRLATDLYLPPKLPAPAIAVRPWPARLARAERRSVMKSSARRARADWPRPP